MVKKNNELKSQVENNNNSILGFIFYKFSNDQLSRECITYKFRLLHFRGINLYKQTRIDLPSSILVTSKPENCLKWLHFPHMLLFLWIPLWSPAISHNLAQPSESNVSYQRHTGTTMFQPPTISKFHYCSQSLIASSIVSIGQAECHSTKYLESKIRHLWSP